MRATEVPRAEADKVVNTGCSRARATAPYVKYEHTNGSGFGKRLQPLKQRLVQPVLLIGSSGGAALSLGRI